MKRATASTPVPATARVRPGLAPGPARLALLTLVTLSFFGANSLLARAALGPGLADAASYTSIRLASGAAVLLALSLATGRGLPRGGSVGSALALFGYAFLAEPLLGVKAQGGLVKPILFTGAKSVLFLFTVWAVYRLVRYSKGHIPHSRKAVAWLENNLRGPWVGSVNNTPQYSPAGEPQLDRFTGILVLIGMIMTVLMRKVREQPETWLWWLMLLAGWLSTQLITVGTPNGARGIGYMPTLIYFAAVALDGAIRLIPRLPVALKWQRTAGLLASACVIACVVAASVFAQALRDVTGLPAVTVPERHGKVDWQILDEMRRGAGQPDSVAGPLTRRFVELSEDVG